MRQESSGLLDFPLAPTPETDSGGRYRGGRIGRVAVNMNGCQEIKYGIPAIPMDIWLHNLPVWQMALVVFAITYLAAGGIFAIIMALAKGERVRVFKSVSASLLPPLGIIFGLLVVFSVVQVWSDIDRAKRRSIARQTQSAWWYCWPPAFRESRKHRFATWSAAILTKPFSLSGPRWRSNRLP